MRLTIYSLLLVALQVVAADPTYQTNVIAASGGDYTSLFNWEAGEDDTGDIVSSNWISWAEIRGTWSNADTQAVTISGWTTDATRFIVITNSTSKHTGKLTASAYLFDGIGTAAITINESFVRIYGLQLQQTSTAGGKHIITVTAIATGSSDIRIADCIFKGVFSGASGGGIGIFSDDADTIINTYNCIFYDFVNAAVSCRAVSIQNCTLNLINCTAHNCYQSFNESSGTFTATNCISQDASNDGFVGGIDGDYNCSDIASDAPGANSNNDSSTDVLFVNEAGDDFHLAAGDTEAKDLGVANPSSLFTTDLDGQTRSGSWDIGADEYQATSTTVRKPLRLRR